MPDCANGPAVDTPQIYRAIGSAVKDLRRQSNMTQQEVADAIGMSRASVANIERGEQRVFVDQLFDFVKIFDVAGLDSIIQHERGNAATRGPVPLSGDTLKRRQIRQVKSVVDEILTEARL